MQKVNDTKDFSNTIARYDSPVFDNYYGFDKNQPADRQIVYCSLYELPENEIGALHFHDTIELGPESESATPYTEYATQRPMMSKFSFHTSIIYRAARRAVTACGTSFR